MAVTEPKIHIIGIGGDGLAGLTARGRELLAAAGLVLGSESTLKLLPEIKAERRPIGSDLQEVVRLEHCGHHAQFTHPAKLAEVVRGFLTPVCAGPNDACGAR